MNQKPLLVLVTGVPGSGKTTLARLLARELGLVALSRDDVKERLWDAWQDRPHLLPEVPQAHFGAYYAALHALLRAGVDVVAEGSVHSSRGVPEIEALLPAADAVVVHCQTLRETSHARFRARTGADRHPAHRDAALVQGIRDNPSRWAHFEQPVALDLPRLIVDTGSRYRPEQQDILNFVRRRGQTQAIGLSDAARGGQPPT